MPKTRRKSLSFREVESFLTEISTVTNDINKSVDNFFQFDDVDGSNYQLSSTFPKKMETAKRSDADLIREFCKLNFQKSAKMDYSVHNFPSKSKELAKRIFENTKYKLVATRIVHPEQFIHPIDSTEGKKSLIMSLAPMLTDAEEQRKRDTLECEEFTRCRSMKIKGRGSYEYTDVDTAQKIEFAEYETRYMLFINRNKPKRVHLPIASSPDIVQSLPEPAPLPNGINKTIPDVFDDLEEDKENQSIRSNRSLEESMGDIHDKTNLKKKSGDRKRKYVTSDRRGTLSPASARAMALKAVEEESHKELTSVESKSNISEESSSTGLATATFEEDIDLISFDDVAQPLAATSTTTTRSHGRRRASALFSVSEAEMALVNTSLSSTASSSSSSPPSTIATGLVPVEPHQPYPKKRSPLLSRTTPVKSPLVKLSDHLSHRHSPITTPDTNVKVALNFHDSHQDLMISTDSSFSQNESQSRVTHHVYSQKINQNVLIDTDMAMDEEDFLSTVTSNQTRVFDFFDDDLLYPTPAASTTCLHNTGTIPMSIACDDDQQQRQQMIAEEESLMKQYDSSPVSVMVRFPSQSSHPEDTPSGQRICYLEETEVKRNSSSPMDSDLSILQSVTEYHYDLKYVESLPDSIDEQEWEAQAKQRLHERFMFARNQFQWELVSAQAVNTAILRVKTKFAQNQ